MLLYSRHYFIENISLAISMKKLPIKIILIMFSFKEKRQKNITVNVQNVINQIQTTLGANRAMPPISVQPFPHGRREIWRLIFYSKLPIACNNTRIGIGVVAMGN